MTQVSRLFAKVEIKFGFMETPNVSPSARNCAQAGLAFRYHVDLVLPVATGAQTSRALGYAALAGSAIHWACQVGERRK